MAVNSSGFNRVPVDLSHFAFTNGKIGELFTLDVQLVQAGDSYQNRVCGSLKMSPLFRELTLDPKLDLFAFYMPHRYVYGDDKWTEFIKAGPVPHNSINDSWPVPPRFETQMGFSKGTKNQSRSLWRMNTFLDIYNNYFKRPTDADLDPANIFPAADPDPITCCWPKNIWSAELPAIGDKDVSLTSNKLSLQHLVEQAAQYDVEQERQFFQQRYRDVLSSMGGRASVDVDRRPRLISRLSSYTGGYDVNGTGDQSLGSYVGRVQQNFDFVVPRFFCPEHGAIWIVGVMRYDPICGNEVSYLESDASINYVDFVGDANYDRNVSGVRTEQLYRFRSDQTQDGQTVKVAHGAWHQYQPNFVSGDYSDLPGYPFLDDIPRTEKSRHYIDPSLYDDLFETKPLKHWKISSRVNTMIMRNQPSVADTIITGQ